MSSEIVSNSSRSSEIKTMPAPFFWASRSNLCIAAIAPSSNPRVGWQAMIILGFLISQRPSRSFCTFPPESNLLCCLIDCILTSYVSHRFLPLSNDVFLFIMCFRTYFETNICFLILWFCTQGYERHFLSLTFKGTSTSVKETTDCAANRQLCGLIFHWRIQLQEQMIVFLRYND